MKVLSKSRFKLGLECPNKLFFTGNKKYANKKVDDTFLLALAKGGFQVEELARLHYPNGIFIDTEPYEYERAFELTQEALRHENIVIYEAAFLKNNFFIRTDILVKRGNQIRLIEVKAKSFDPNKENTFIGKRGGLDAKHKLNLYDLAFQKYVAKTTYPDFDFEAYFMMADKSKSAKVDGLNQMFRVPLEGNPRTAIIKKINSIEEIGESVLSEINVDSIVNDIISSKYKYQPNLSFDDALTLFKESFINDEYYNWPTHFGTCKKCEFKATAEDKEKGLLCGFEYCFKKQFKCSDEDFKKPNAMEVWNFQGKGLFESNRLFMDDLSEDDFKVSILPDKISPSHRRWIQVEKAKADDNTVYLEKDGLKAEISKWQFPLHFIDFETSTVALPFTSGRFPYEQVAFQFSHHMYYEDGTIEHKSEYINNTPGVFPNFDFVRALKSVLGNDDGTIFKFAKHENSVLNSIINQLKNSNEPDKNDLIVFIKDITQSTKDNVETWVGERNMVDLNEIVKYYYYNPLTKGSNSIKAILPAALKTSNYLKEKYSKTIGEVKLSSKNFESTHCWLKIENGGVTNPYKMLPPVFEGWDELELMENISDIDDIDDGGAALTAYAKLQFQDMTDNERNQITQGLLKYCELDTLAMVMFYEHLLEISHD